MEYFKSYMEDYNTATMPHIKYYNLEKYELYEHNEKLKKKQLKELKAIEKQYNHDDDNKKTLEKKKKKNAHDNIGEYDPHSISSTSSIHLNDEREVQETLRKQKERNAQIEFQNVYQLMKGDTSKRNDMRRQEELQGELQLAYRRGDVVTVKRLERLLAPDDGNSASNAKHPWAG